MFKPLFLKVNPTPSEYNSAPLIINKSLTTDAMRQARLTYMRRVTVIVNATNLAAVMLCQLRTFSQTRVREKGSPLSSKQGKNPRKPKTQKLEKKEEIRVGDASETSSKKTQALALSTNEDFVKTLSLLGDESVLPIFSLPKNIDDEPQRGTDPVEVDSSMAESVALSKVKIRKKLKATATVNRLQETTLLGSSPTSKPAELQAPDAVSSSIPFNLSNSDKARMKTMWYNTHLTFPASDAIYHLQQSTELAVLVRGVSSVQATEEGNKGKGISPDNSAKRWHSPNSFELFANTAFKNILLDAFPIVEGNIAHPKADDVSELESEKGDWEALLTSRVVSSHFRPQNTQKVGRKVSHPSPIVATPVVDAFDPLVVVTDTGRSTVDITPAPSTESAWVTMPQTNAAAPIHFAKSENRWTVLDTDVTPTSVLAAETYAHHRALLDEEQAIKEGHLRRRMLKVSNQEELSVSLHVAAYLKKQQDPQKDPHLSATGGRSGVSITPLDVFKETSGYFISRMANTSYHESLWYTLLKSRSNNNSGNQNKESTLTEASASSSKPSVAAIIFNAKDKHQMGMLRRRRLAIEVKDRSLWDLLLGPKSFSNGKPLHQLLLRHLATSSGGAPHNTLQMGTRQPTPIAPVTTPRAFQLYINAISGEGSESVRRELAKFEGNIKRDNETFDIDRRNSTKSLSTQSTVYIEDPRPPFDPLNPFADPNSMSGPSIMARTGSSIGFTMSSAPSHPLVTSSAVLNTNRTAQREGDQLITVDDGPLGMWLTGPKSPAWSAFIARLVEPDVRPLLAYCDDDVPTVGEGKRSRSNDDKNLIIDFKQHKARREEEINESVRKRAKKDKVNEEQVTTEEALALDARIHHQPMASIMAASTMRYKWHLLYGQAYWGYQQRIAAASPPQLKAIITEEGDHPSTPSSPTFGQCYLHLRALCQLCANDWCGSAIVYERDVTLVSDIGEDVMAAMRKATPLEAVMIIGGGDPLKPTAPAHTATPFSSLHEEAAVPPAPTQQTNFPFSLSTLSLTTLVSPGLMYSQFLEAAIHGPSSSALTGPAPVGSGIGRGFGIVADLSIVQFESNEQNHSEVPYHPATVFPPFRDFVLETLHSRDSEQASSTAAPTPFEGIDYLFRMKTVLPSFAPNTVHSINDPVHQHYAHQSVWFPFFHAFLPVPAAIGLIGPMLLMAPSAAGGSIEGNPFFVPIRNEAAPYTTQGGIATPKKKSNPSILGAEGTQKGEVKEDAAGSLKKLPIDFSALFASTGLPSSAFQYISSAPTTNPSSGTSVGGTFAPTTASANWWWSLEMLSVYCDAPKVGTLLRRFPTHSASLTTDTSPKVLEISPLTKVLLVTTKALLCSDHCPPAGAGDSSTIHWPPLTDKGDDNCSIAYAATTNISQACDHLKCIAQTIADGIQPTSRHDPEAEAVAYISESVWVFGLHPLTFARRIWPHMVTLAKEVDAPLLQSSQHPNGYRYVVPLRLLADLLLFTHEHGSNRGTAMIALYLIAVGRELAHASTVARENHPWRSISPMTSLDLDAASESIIFSSSKRLPLAKTRLGQ